jgi:hypothetical protein
MVVEQSAQRLVQLYRDDGLGIIKATPRQIELIKKDLCALFNNHGLKLLSKRRDEDREFP